MRSKVHESVLQNLKKLSFTSSGKDADRKEKHTASNTNHGNRSDRKQLSQEDTDFHFSHSGRLVAGRQLVYLIDDELGKDQVSFSFFLL